MSYAATGVPPQGEDSVRSSSSVAATAGGLWESPGTCDQQAGTASVTSTNAAPQLNAADGGQFSSHPQVQQAVGGAEGPDRGMSRIMSESMHSIASSSSLSPSPLSPSRPEAAVSNGQGAKHPGSHLSALKLPETPTGSSNDLQQGHQEEASYVVGEYHEKNCPICLERYTESNPAIFYPCNHTFHLQCAESWYQRNRSCPVCLRHTDTSSGRLMTPRDIQKTRSSREKRRAGGGGGNSRKSSGTTSKVLSSSASSAVSSASWLQRQGGKTGSGVELAHDLTDSDSDHAVRRPLIHTSAGHSPESGSGTSSTLVAPVATAATTPGKTPGAIPGEESEGELREEETRPPSAVEGSTGGSAPGAEVDPGAGQQPQGGAPTSLIRNPKAAMLRGLRVFARLCC
jgi:hypothetical protein